MIAKVRPINRWLVRGGFEEFVLFPFDCVIRMLKKWPLKNRLLVDEHQFGLLLKPTRLHVLILKLLGNREAKRHQKLSSYTHNYRRLSETHLPKSNEEDAWPLQTDKNRKRETKTIEYRSDWDGIQWFQPTAVVVRETRGRWCSHSRTAGDCWPRSRLRI